MVDYRQTPPIQWLPIFEAAASQLSFKKAADQLHVTPPAVSQQIKSLEQWLGVQLFERHARRLSLTAEGEFYLQIARKVMQSHKQGYLEFQRRFHNTSLHVSAPLFVTQEILIPNYLSFNDYSPATELRIEARMSLVDFDVEPMDAAIRFGNGDWPGLDCRRLCHANIVPVCSERYLQANSIKDIDELLNHRLIYSSPEMRDWSPLFPQLAEIEHSKLVCDSYLSAIKSASEGLGIALALLPATNQWINDGRLVLPLDFNVATDSGYWVVAPQRDSQSQVVDAFYQWSKSLFDKLPALDQKVNTVEL
ncbi:MAG: LysR substrate-binding domain-containing protein [Pseudomonadales bacterium]|nr:LysR substrate-binding domain-containing protein [Pseudomonadales bacterium]